MCVCVLVAEGCDGGEGGRGLREYDVMQGAERSSLTGYVGDSKGRTVQLFDYL